MLPRSPRAKWPLKSAQVAVGLAMLVYLPRIKIAASDSSWLWSADRRAPRHQKELKCPGKPRYLHGQLHRNGAWVSCQTPAAMSNNELVFGMPFWDVRAAKRAMEEADARNRLIQGVPTDQPVRYTCPRETRPTTLSRLQDDAKRTISLLDGCPDCLHPTIDRLVLCTFQESTPPNTRASGAVLVGAHTPGICPPRCKFPSCSPLSRN
jgi:hypothetical protein